VKTAVSRVNFQRIAIQWTETGKQAAKNRKLMTGSKLTTRLPIADDRIAGCRA